MRELSSKISYRKKEYLTVKAGATTEYSGINYVGSPLHASSFPSLRSKAVRLNHYKLQSGLYENNIRATKCNTVIWF